MTQFGHNERSFRLDALADEARNGLERVERGEEWTIGGWLAYGHALNEGRALFSGDKEFGEWVALSQLDTADRMDRAAAMWADANPVQLEEARQRGNPRTIRGMHAKWKEIEAEREAAARAEAEAQAQREAAEKAKADADRAKIEADKAAAEEAETRAAVEVAKTKQNRETANAKLADAINARKEAEKKAEEADQAAQSPAAEPEPAPDPYNYAKLTEDALLDLANGLRADLEDEKVKRKAAKSEVRKLKEKLADLTADDKSEVIRRLQADVKTARSAKFRALEDRDAYLRQVHALKKRVKELERMGVPK